MVTPLTHTDGLPNWIDVIVDSSEKRVELQAFLNTLFDWTWDVGTEEMGYYSVASFNGEPVMGLGQGEGAKGDWTVYFKTSAIDSSIEHAQGLGATVNFPAMAIMDIGSMALLTDPQGASFGFWQPNEFHGFNIAYEPNAPGWFDHVSPDPAAASAFYVALTGQELLAPGPEMRILHHGEQWFASISHDQVNREPRWNPIFVVDSLERIRERVPRHGGSILIEEMKVPGSALCIFTEPVNGSVMSVMQAGSHE
jgi:uncharacterized protein